MKECGFSGVIPRAVGHDSGEGIGCGSAYVWLAVTGQCCEQPYVLGLGSVSGEAGGPGATVRTARHEGRGKRGEALVISSQRRLEQGSGT